MAAFRNDVWLLALDPVLGPDPLDADGALIAIVVAVRLGDDERKLRRTTAAVPLRPMLLGV